MAEMESYCVHILDNPGKEQARLDLVDAHRDYAYGPDVEAKVTLSGPLIAEDGETWVGSLYLVDAPNRGALDKFLDEDPFQTGGVWGPRQVHRFWKRVG